MTPDFKPVQSEHIHCVICRAEIKGLKGTYQSPEFHSVVCKECVEQFPPNDIDMMISLFYVYGGYYGQMKEVPFSVLEFLLLILNNKKEKEGSIEDFIDEFSKKSFHQALLHGLSPSEYIKSLHSLFD